jgi:2-methylcitrate dehydratase PrpD
VAYRQLMVLHIMPGCKRGVLTAEHQEPHAQAETRSFDGLVAWALETDAAALPENVLSRAALLVADELAALLAAAEDPAVRAAQAALLPIEETGAAAVLTKPFTRTSVRNAAMANAVALSWMELDEGFASASCHAGLYILPTLAAHADVSGASVRSVLGHLAVAYEVLARLAMAYPAPRFSWHPHAMWSSLGAALGRCLATGRDLDVTLRSLRMAASLANLGGYEAAIDGAEIRNIWAGVGVSNGCAACDLAVAGLDGPTGAPDSVFARLTGREYTDGRVYSQDLGVRWALFESFTKEYACCQSMHSAIEAALEIQAMEGFSAHDVTAIEIETPRVEMDNVAPRNRLAAQFSLPHAVAVTLLRGRADASGFSAATIDDPDVKRLRNVTTLNPWPNSLETPNARPATVRVFRHNGDVVSRTRLRSRNLSLEQREKIVRAKIRAYGEPRFGQAAHACAGLLSCDEPTLSGSWRDFTAVCFSD